MGAAKNCGIQIEARIQNIHWQFCTNGPWRATEGEKDISHICNLVAVVRLLPKNLAAPI